MDMIEQAEVSYKKLPGTAWKLIYLYYRAFSQSARTPEKEIKRLLPFPHLSWWSMIFLHFRHQCWKATPIAAKAAVFSKGNRCWLGDVSSREGQVISIYINWTFVFCHRTPFLSFFPLLLMWKTTIMVGTQKFHTKAQSATPCWRWRRRRVVLGVAPGVAQSQALQNPEKTSICPCLLKWTVSDRAAGDDDDDDDDDDDKLKVVVRKNVLKTVCRVGLWSVVTAAGLIYSTHPCNSSCASPSMWVNSKQSYQKSLPFPCHPSQESLGC